MSQQQQQHQHQHQQHQQQQRKRVTNMMDWDSLNEWAKDKPLSILQLDPADRAVLKIAGEFSNINCLPIRVEFVTEQRVDILFIVGLNN